MHKYSRARYPTLFLLLFIATINAIANYWHLYFHLPWLDIPMHVLGGLWVAFFSLAWYYHTPLIHPKDRSTLFVIMFATSTTMIIGLCWELFEFSAQTLIERADVHNLGDTLFDLVNDLVGALLATALFIRMGYNKRT